MAHAYTPGLRVASECMVRKERLLPLKGDVLVEKGATVRAKDIVAKTELPGDVEILNASFELACEPKTLADRLLKGEGDPVVHGEVLGTKSGFLGLFKSELLAPCDGAIETISSVTGKILLRKPPIPVDVTAYMDGTVVEVIENEGVVVECPASFIQGIIGVGGETHGELALVSSSPDDILDADSILPEHAGKVLVGGRLVTQDALTRAGEVGAAAIVVGGIHDEDLEAYLGYALGVAITGHEDLPVTVMVTEGFGEIRMADRTYDLFRKLEGKGASVNGATQIRAGVIRPEVVIPIESSGRVDEQAAGRMGVGDTVRIIREPHFGILAEVVALPSELVQVESETKVRALKVRLPGGDEVILPRANVEVIVA